MCHLFLLMACCLFNHLQRLSDLRGSEIPSMTLLWSTAFYTLHVKHCESYWVFFLCKVLILVFEQWLLHDILPEQCLSSIYSIIFQTVSNGGSSLSTQNSQAKAEIELLRRLELLHHPSACACAVCRTFEIPVIRAYTSSQARNKRIIAFGLYCYEVFFYFTSVSWNSSTGGCRGFLLLMYWNVTQQYVPNKMHKCSVYTFVIFLKGVY